MTALDDIAAERRRQIEMGYTHEVDDAQEGGELAILGAMYAVPDPHRQEDMRAWMWPFPRETFTPRDRSTRDNLIRAAALIVAEIDRLDRAAAQEKSDDE